MAPRRGALRASTSLNSGDPLSDFRNFLYLVWKHLDLPDPTPVQYDIAEFLQHGPDRIVIEAFRGVGKSWITVAFVVWLLYCNPQLKIMVVSASKQRADNFSTFALSLIHDIPQLRHLAPRGDQRSSKISFDVAPARPDDSPSVKSVGITGQITGSRADVIVADDIEVVSNSATQALRDRIKELVKEFAAVIKAKPAKTRIIYLGTPQTEQSLYNALPERGYTVRIWPARYPSLEKAEKYGTRLAPILANALRENPELAGQPTDSQRFDDEDLESRYLEYGKSGWLLQFMLDTSLSDEERFPLKLSDLIVMSLNDRKAPTDIIWASSPENAHNDLPNVGLDGDALYRPMMVEKEWIDYTGSVMAIDPSGRGSDETAYCVLKMLHGRLYMTAAGGFKGGYSDETLEKLLGVAKAQQVNKIIVEPNFGDGMFAQLLRAASQKLYRVSIEDAKWSTAQKERRIIDTLEPVLNQHRLIVDPKVIESDYRSTEEYPLEEQNRYRMFWQMTRITKEKGCIPKDDRLDALAMAVAYWLEYLSRNTEKAQEDHKARQLKEEIRAFKKGLVMSDFGRRGGQKPRRGIRAKNRGLSLR